jgi:anti-anti-sigma regulatory factor
LRLAGEGDISSVAVLKRAFSHAARSEADVHVDASRLEFMDLAGARYLIDIGAQLGPGHRIVMHQPRRAIRRLFEILAERGDAVELAA